MNKRQKKKLYRKRVGCNPPKQMRHRGRLFNTPGEVLIAYLEDILKPLKEITQKLTQNRSKETVQYANNTKNIVNTARILSRRRKK